MYEFHFYLDYDGLHDLCMFLVRKKHSLLSPHPLHPIITILTVYMTKQEISYSSALSIYDTVLIK